jgi:hypothetical protein
MTPEADDSRETEWSECLPPIPPVGATVPTICGGTLTYSANTPCAMYNGQRVFFCLAICKSDFDRDPQNSCLMFGPYCALK